MGWRTSDEIRFINGLGQHTNPKRVVPVEEKLEYLYRYKNAMRLRVRWDGINVAEIRDYVDNRLAYYEKVVKSQKET